jgi:hypothetical protein
MTIEAADIRASRVFDQLAAEPASDVRPFDAPLFASRGLFRNDDQA